MLSMIMRLTADLQAALKAKEEAYVRLLKRQAEDVDNLLGFMERQAGDMSSAYAEELEAVERALLEVGGRAAGSRTSVCRELWVKLRAGVGGGDC